MAHELNCVAASLLHSVCFHPVLFCFVELLHSISAQRGSLLDSFKDTSCRFIFTMLAVLFAVYVTLKMLSMTVLAKKISICKRSFSTVLGACDDVL